MPRNLNKKFFLQNGKHLSPKNTDYIETISFPREAIASLSNIKPSRKEKFYLFYNEIKEALPASIASKNFTQSIKWGISSSFVSMIFAIFIFQIPLVSVHSQAPQKYTIFSSKPLKLDSIGHELNIKDSRAVKIDSVFEHFNCPLTGYGEAFVKEADNNQIPYWLVAAIAFQESSCAKNTPVANGIKTYNAWGWAVYGDQVHDFDSFESGISVVSKYMYKRFYSRGINDLCEIMKVYTPPSNGSWCAGVKYFGDFIDNYRTPERSL